MPVLKCGICGGDLNITPGADIAVCGSCGGRTELPREDVEKYIRLFKSADTLIANNTVAGYKAAISQLQTVSYIPEAERKIDYCEKRIIEIKEARLRSEREKAANDEGNTKVGLILISLFALFGVALLAGICYIAYHLYMGDLSPNAVKAIIAAVVLIAAFALIGKIKS